MDVACAGILVADIFAEPVDRLPLPGELKTTERFLFSPGGCAANVANDLRRLGRTVRVIGKVGEDSLGVFVVSCLKENGVDTRFIQCGKHPTSATVILDVIGEDRRYLHSIGANGDFSAADFDMRVLDDVRVLYVGGYLAMPAFGASDLARILHYAKARGITTVLDVVLPLDMRDAAAAVLPVLPETDYFLPNEDEARILTGEHEAHKQASALGLHNPHAAIIITRGAKGSTAWHCGEIIETPAFLMRSVDESGAGDAFAAGLIVGILEQWGLERTLRFASAVGGSCTRALGCSTSVFEFEEAIRFLRDNDPALINTGSRG
jgi:sugar/nucleoside kinase (ribokinase family)